MSLDIQRQNLFSTCYGSDPCEDIRENILKINTQQQPQETQSLSSRWKTDSEQYSGNLKL